MDERGLAPRRGREGVGEGGPRGMTSLTFHNHASKDGGGTWKGSQRH
jgi:hypothetical protein